ncbi:hypothetical protein AVEN_113523-1 [Araneus ventricosus]|uniref:Uncharacterized protein n=1 Tax=Araneus ventricosus TaxID=182803 RepID=A0A4Y2SBT0_ARAVE|nr:hypothetical protein AVEN_113523-1 [Araneus ventricosus]
MVELLHESRRTGVPLWLVVNLPPPHSPPIGIITDSSILEYECLISILLHLLINLQECTDSIEEDFCLESERAIRLSPRWPLQLTRSSFNQSDLLRTGVV